MKVWKSPELTENYDAQTGTIYPYICVTVQGLVFYELILLLEMRRR